ncbi:MAG: TIGR03087 family PEP-CTERM/XrtA system glycosyltransferase [Candidatus Rokubacteria bacterium]|nr:TIGR03087 family PEP-CTERM/XrtA system glycosyltransferase [Candidatus Rokubacteria bacterium]
MKILFLCHRIPYPPQRGGKIRPFNMIRHLAVSHEVTVATLARTADELAAGQELHRYCHDLHVGRISKPAGWARFALYGMSAAPATFGYFYSPELARTVRRLLATRGFDAIVVHCSSMGPYVAGHRGCRKVMDFGDADSEKWLEYARTAPFPLSQAFRLEGRKVRRYEAWLGKQFDACSVNAPREGDVLAAYVDSPIRVIPNGVDLEYFEPTRPSGRGYVPNRIVFTGNMSYRPNVDAVQHLVTAVLPRIRREIPDVQLCIVGMDPTPAVLRLADEDRVVVTGRVDDVRPYFDSAAVAVAPLRVARGLQNKVLEAMAMRVPVVASQAAFEGISAVPGRDLLVAAGPKAFSRAVVTLLRDPAARERYAAAGRTCVETNHNWSRLLQRLEDLVVGGDQLAATVTRPSSH